MNIFKRRNVLPGFGFTLGFTLTYISLIVILPLVMIFIHTSGMGGRTFGRLLLIQESSPLINYHLRLRSLPHY